MQIKNIELEQVAKQVDKLIQNIKLLKRGFLKQIANSKIYSHEAD